MGNNRHQEGRDPTPIAAIVRAHQQAVYATAYRVLRGDAAGAMDAAQKVFLELLRGRVRLRAGDDIGMVLRWRAVRIARSATRSDARRLRREREAAAMREHETDRSPTTQAESSERRALIRRAVDELPDPLRTAVVLRFLDGMTIEGVASALGCAVSTAHARIQRGLQTLEKRLAPATPGLAVLSQSAIEAELRTLAEPVTAPAVFEGLIGDVVDAAGTQMLQMQSAPTLSTVTIAAAGLTLAGVAIAASTLAGPQPERLHAASGPATETRRAVETAAQPPDSATTETARTVVTDPTPTPKVADDQTASIGGRVLDTDGRPVPGATLRFASLEYQAKQPRFVVEAAVVAGTFSAELPVADDSGQAYRVHCTADGYEMARDRTMLLHANEVQQLADLTLRRLLDDRPGPWRAEIVVVDAHGAPLTGADIAIFRRSPNGETVRAEVRGRTGPGGRVRLGGTWLGEKRLRVSARHRPELAAVTEDWPLDSFGPHQRTVKLGTGHSMSGVVLHARTGQPLAGIPIEVRGGEGEAAFTRRASTDAAGHFAVTGVPERDAEVSSCGNDELSPFRLPSAPCVPDLVIRMKNRDDDRAHGVFLGELHGRLVDTHTGTVVPHHPMQLQLHWVGDEVRSWRDVAAARLQPAPVQVSIGTMSFDEYEALRHDAFHETAWDTGRVVVLAWCDGYAVSGAGPFDIGPGILHRGIEVGLERGCRIAGKVFGPDGQPLKDVYLHVGPPGDDRLIPSDGRGDGETVREQRRMGTTVRADTDGSFAIDNLPTRAGPLIVYAMDGRGHAGQSAPFTPTDRGELTLPSVRMARTR